MFADRRRQILQGFLVEDLAGLRAVGPDIVQAYKYNGFRRFFTGGSIRFRLSFRAFLRGFFRFCLRFDADLRRIQNGQVDNCLIRGFNKDSGNQNIVTVYKGGRLLNCTIVDGLCGNASDEALTACAAVRAEEGARVENCAIAGVRYANGDNTFSVRAWTGSAASFDHCATDTAEPINASCITITTSAFRDFAHQDYRPRPGSVLLNKGRTNELADGTDLGGDRRKFGAQDIGCYEFARAGFALTFR